MDKGLYKTTPFAILAMLIEREGSTVMMINVDANLTTGCTGQRTIVFQTLDLADLTTEEIFCSKEVHTTPRFNLKDFEKQWYGVIPCGHWMVTKKWGK